MTHLRKILVEAMQLKIKHEKANGNDPKDIIVYAYDGTKIIGKAIFGMYPFKRYKGHPYCFSVKVDEDYRRKGIATQMYLYAEKHFGKKLAPSANQSEDSKALWNDPNRKFGVKLESKFILATQRQEADNKTFFDVIESYALESEPSSSVEDWLDTFESLPYKMKYGAYKKWTIKKIDPQTVKSHHNNQDPMNMADIRKANRPDDVPPIILDAHMKTIDGAHRSRVAREDKWPYIWAWIPDPASKMTQEEIDYILDEEIDSKERVERMKGIAAA